MKAHPVLIKATAIVAIVILVLLSLAPVVYILVPQSVSVEQLPLE